MTSLPTLSSTANKAKQSQNLPPADLKCGICLETMRTVKALWCGHAFDTECINKAISLSAKCPLCRAKIQKFTGIGSEDKDPTFATIESTHKTCEKLQSACNEYWAAHPEEAKMRDEEKKDPLPAPLIQRGITLSEDEVRALANGAIGLVTELNDASLRRLTLVYGGIALVGLVLLGAIAMAKFGY